MRAPPPAPLCIGLWLLGSGCALVRPAATPSTATARLVERALHDNRSMDHLRHLTQEIGPRLTGSFQYDRAAEWCLAEFQSYGLEARLETWGEFPVRFDRGTQAGRELRPQPRQLVFHTRAWTRGTEGVVRGRAVLEPRNEAELEACRAELGGAWILRRAQRPDEGTAKALEALFGGPTAPAGFVRSARGELLQMSGSQRVEYSELDRKLKPTEIVLRGDQHDSLVAELERGETVELEFQSENRFAPGPVPCTNVVADLVGREFPDQFVIVGAHLDSWDGAEGAQDNGTGVCSTLEAARLIASLGLRPRRTIRFVLFGGEEQGLLGSGGYVRKHAAELSKVSAVLIHDGGQNPLRGLEVSYAMLDDMEQVLAPVATLDPARPVRVEEVLGLVNSGDSDHAPFLGKQPVPAFFWEQSEDGYEHVHHTQYDTFETVKPLDEEHNARVVAVVAWGLAQLEHLLDRTDMAPLARRRLMVGDFEGNVVRQVVKDGRAAQAGWQEGDAVLSVDGVPVADRSDIVRLVNLGSPRKTIRIRRGQQELETHFDWSDEKDEPERSARAGRREAWRRAHGRG